MAETLIIYAHPGGSGHCNYILKKILEKVSDYELLDLYKIGYDPILKEDELYTAGNRKISKETKEIQKKILDAKKLIIIFPMWWGSTPAILKGFFDRTFTSGFAYKYNGKIMPEKLLSGRRAAVFVTSGGKKWMYSLFGNPIKKSVKMVTLQFTGINSKIFQYYNARKLNEENKEKLNKLVGKGISWLNQT